MTRNVTRRQLLRTAAPIAGGALVGAVGLPAAAGAVPSGPLKPNGRFRIDVHCHHLPDFYVTSLKEHGITSAGGKSLPSWSPSEAVLFMDEFGIQTQVVSIRSTRTQAPLCRYRALAHRSRDEVRPRNDRDIAHHVRLRLAVLERGVHRPRRPGPSTRRHVHQGGASESSSGERSRPTSTPRRSTRDMSLSDGRRVDQHRESS